MTARRLTFAGPGDVVVEDIDVPEPGPDELLVRAEYSAISPGTELLIYRNEVPADLELDETIDTLEGSFEYPLQYGYASVGTVVDTGVDVADGWMDRRVFAFHPHSSHFTVPMGEVHSVPDGIRTPVATFLPAVETAINLCMDANPRVGERVVVFGQGPIGLVTTMLLSTHPLERLFAVEPLENRRERSREAGVDEAFHPDDLVGLRSTLSGDHADGADLSIELSGDPRALDQAVDVTGFGGRVIIGSWYGTKPAALDLGGRFHRSRITLQSSQVSTVDPSLRGRWNKSRRLALAADRLATLDLEPLVTHRIPIDRAPEAYRLLDREPNEAVQVLLTYP